MFSFMRDKYIKKKKKTPRDFDTKYYSL
jgi:hypothetical protein